MHKRFEDLKQWKQWNSTNRYKKEETKNNTSKTSKKQNRRDSVEAGESKWKLKKKPSQNIETTDLILESGEILHLIKCCMKVNGVRFRYHRIGSTGTEVRTSRGYRFSVTRFETACPKSKCKCTGTLSVVGRGLNTFNLSSAARVNSSRSRIYRVVAEIRSGGSFGKRYVFPNELPDFQASFAN